MEFHSFVYILLSLTVKTEKMELIIGDNVINDEHSIPIVITSDMIKPFVKGCHAYKNLWKPFINEELTTALEPDNVVDKYEGRVKKNIVILGHLLLGKGRRFAKMIFYFLRANRYPECKVIITGKEVNLGNGEGMQVPCLLKIPGTKNMLQILYENIQN